jgi:hypothetical protein
MPANSHIYTRTERFWKWTYKVLLNDILKDQDRLKLSKIKWFIKEKLSPQAGSLHKVKMAILVTIIYTWNIKPKPFGFCNC